jgi:hypothetical protein
MGLLDSKSAILDGAGAMGARRCMVPGYHGAKLLVELSLFRIRLRSLGRKCR